MPHAVNYCCGAPTGYVLVKNAWTWWNRYTEEESVGLLGKSSHPLDSFKHQDAYWLG